MQRNNKKKVTVFIATYNQCAFLEKAISSALKQDYPREQYEIFVIDDGSTDGTKDLLSKYEGKVRVLYQSNIGLPETCNRGIKEARGEYFIRLDSDDFFDEKILSLETEAISSRPGIAAVYSDRTLIYNDHQKVISLTGNNIYEIIACGVMMRTNMLRRIKGYRKVFWEEYDLFLRLSQFGKFHHIPYPLYSYRRHDCNMTNDIELCRKGWRELVSIHGREKIINAGNCDGLEIIKDMYEDKV